MSRRYELFSIALLVTVGFIARLDLLIANNFVIDSDEAIVGLMAKHILEGAPIPTFYYGQHYMGSLEPIVVAGVFALCGISSVALKIVPLFFSMLVLLLVHGIARMLLGSRAALFALLCMALPPAPLLVWSSMARGGFIEIVFIGVLSMLLLMTWLRSPRYCTLFGLGFLLGVGWWVNNQILYFICVAAFAVVGQSIWHFRPVVRSALVTALVGGIAFLLGSLPYSYYQISRNFPARQMFAPVKVDEALIHLSGVLAHSLPVIFGTEQAWSEGEHFPGAKLIGYFLYSIFLCAFFILRRKEIGELVFCKLDGQKPLELFFLIIPVAIGAFCWSSFGFLVTAPRYLLPIYPSLFVLAAFVIDHIWESKRTVAATLLGVLLLLNLASNYLFGRAIPGEPFVYQRERVSKSHEQLIHWLTGQGVTMVRTNYWIGYRLAFETRERVQFSIFQDPDQVRIPSYEKRAGEIADSKKPFVLTAGQAQRVAHALTVQGRTFKEKELSGYRVIYDVEDLPKLSSPLAGSSIAVSGFRGNGEWANILDGDTHSRWGSAAPQAPGMELVFTLSMPRSISGIDYELGDWPQDFPRRLRVEWEGVDGARHVLFSESEIEDIRYLQNSRNLALRFPPREMKKLILMQRGSDPIFDWSIAELRFSSSSD